VLAALVHPLFMAGLAYTVFALPMPWANAVMADAVPIFTMSLLSGYASTILLDIIGLRRRGLLAHAWVLALTPLHWLLLSLAAWRALFQLIYDPQRWEKTEHGLARHSRLALSRGGDQSRRQLHEERPPPISASAPTGLAVIPIGPGVPIAPIELMRTRHAPHN